jgi:putative FmdB family regulatory protein
MPLYEYQCESCQKVTERIQKFSDPLMETCPACGGPVKKLLSSPAFHLKGSGWYITDYARKSSNEAGKSSTSSAESSDKAAEKAEKAEKSDSPEKSEKSEKAAKTETKSESSTSTSTKSDNS